MSLAQALANIIQQEAHTRGQLGIQKAGVIPNAIQNGAEGLQGALMQMGQRETRGLQNENLRMENKVQGLKLTKAERDARNEEEIKAIMAAIPDGPDAMPKRIEAFVKFWQARDPQKALDMQKSLMDQDVAQSEIGKNEASAMASRAAAIREREGGNVVAPGGAFIPFGEDKPSFTNPALPPKEIAEKEDSKIGEVTENSIKYSVFRKRGTDEIYRKPLGKQDKTIPPSIQMSASEDIGSWKEAIETGQAKLTDVPFSARGKVNAAVVKGGNLNLPKDVREKVGGVQQAKNLLAPAKELMEKIIAGEDRVTNSALLENYTSSIATLLSRSLGEKGVATEGDVNRAKGLVAGWKGANFLPDFARREMALLEGLLEAQDKALTTSYFKKVPSGAAPTGRAGWDADKKARFEAYKRNKGIK